MEWVETGVQAESARNFYPFIYSRWTRLPSSTSPTTSVIVNIQNTRIYAQISHPFREQARRTR